MISGTALWHKSPTREPRAHANTFHVQNIFYHTILVDQYDHARGSWGTIPLQQPMPWTPLLAQRSLELFSWNISRIRRRSSNSRRAEGLLRSSSICLISHLRCNMIADSSPEDSSVSTVRTSMLKRKKGACALLPRHVEIQTFARQDAILHQPVHHEGLLTDRRNSGDRRALRTPSPFLLPPSGDRIALEWSVGLHVWSCVIVRM